MKQPYRKASISEVHDLLLSDEFNIICMSNVPGYPDRRTLTAEFPCPMKDGSIDMLMITFTWDGSSSPTTPAAQFLIPRHAHPCDSARHDHRCEVAKTMEERRWADNEYRKGILNTKVTREGGTIGTLRYYRKKTWLGVQSVAGYIGVSIGAFLGIGNRF